MCPSFFRPRALRGPTELKAVRLCFLLLLAVVLPIRGAVAAAMLCEVGGSGTQSEVRMADNHAMGHDHAGHDHGGDAHHASGVDKCNMCSAFCSITPLPSDVPTLAEPLDLAAVESSDHAAPPPEFFSGGQERPPRTC